MSVKPKMKFKPVSASKFMPTPVNATHHRRSSSGIFSSPSSRKLSTISEDTLTPLNEPFQAGHADLALTKLLQCSTVFRNTLSSTSGPNPGPGQLATPPPSPKSGEHLNNLPEIHLTDPIIESSFIISLFLRLSYGQSLPVPSLPVYVKAYENLALFLKKWECASDPLLESLSGSIKLWIKEGYVSASKGLQIGDALGDEGVMLDATRRGGEYTWSGRLIRDPTNDLAAQRPAQGKSSVTMSSHSPLEISCGDEAISAKHDKHGNNFQRRQPLSPLSPISTTTIPKLTSEPPFDILNDGLPDQPSLDLSAVPYEYFVSLSDEVKFALLRASRAEEKRRDTDWDKVASEFQRVLKELRRAN
uniref:Uncharacterized protein n=1 Tax=Kwoniella dejecticola CBS 10117 TaxID=1296121 RepID=A0A1A6A6Q5_9TREE|nr:uncharacterized protein I303_03457 [Kwoniella dejecticola CBS 10117]OBR85746.1 hypothetical protein I303_03457 [Kwoniella dejecticola CBS 10117]